MTKKDFTFGSLFKGISVTNTLNKRERYFFTSKCTKTKFLLHYARSVVSSLSNRFSSTSSFVRVSPKSIGRHRPWNGVWEKWRCLTTSIINSPFEVADAPQIGIYLVQTSLKLGSGSFWIIFRVGIAKKLNKPEPNSFLELNQHYLEFPPAHRSDLPHRPPVLDHSMVDATCQNSWSPYKDHRLRPKTDR